MEIVYVLIVGLVWFLMRNSSKSEAKTKSPYPISGWEVVYECKECGHLFPKGNTHTSRFFLPEYCSNCGCYIAEYSRFVSEEDANTIRHMGRKLSDGTWEYKEDIENNNELKRLNGNKINYIIDKNGNEYYCKKNKFEERIFKLIKYLNKNNKKGNTISVENIKRYLEGNWENEVEEIKINNIN